MFLLRWISGWPLGLLHGLGGLLGWLVWLASPTYRRRVRVNADLAGVDARARRQSIAESGRMVTETPWLWLRADDDDMRRLVEWRDTTELDAAIAERRPIVILTPHMGSFEVAARSYAVRYGGQQALTVLYRPARQRALRELQERARQRPMMATAPASLAGVRQMLRALKKRETVGLLPDQVPPAGQGVWAPFFGERAYTMTLAARLVQQAGAECFVLRCERLPGGRGYVVLPSRLVRPLPAGTDEAALVEAATIVNETMEKLIQGNPGQYLWGYNRYKTPRASEAVEPAAAPRTEGKE